MYLPSMKICGVVVLPVAAHAERAPARSVFALVVTSNKSQKLSRPDLHYADDDGARYYELFRTMAPEASRPRTAAIRPGRKASSCLHGLRRPVTSTTAVAPR